MGGFIGGESCGTLTKITKIDRLPKTKQEIEDLNCVIVKDEKLYQEYKRIMKLDLSRL